MRDKIRVRVPQTHKKNKSKPEIVKYQQKYSSVSRNQTRPQKHYEYQVYEYWYSREALTIPLGKKCEQHRPFWYTSMRDMKRQSLSKNLVPG